MAFIKSSERGWKAGARMWILLTCKSRIKKKNVMENNKVETEDEQQLADKYDK